MKNFIQSRRGFTLIEIVVTLAVFVILVGAVIPSLTTYAQRMKELGMARHEELVDKALRQYYAYEGKFPQVQSLDDAGDTTEYTLDAGQKEDLRNRLRDITSTRINIDDYNYAYNENTGQCTLSFA